MARRNPPPAAHRDAPPQESESEARLPLVIDLARLSYRELRRQYPALGRPLFHLWLHLMRPGVVCAAWVLIALHLWHYFVPQAPRTARWRR